MSFFKEITTTSPYNEQSSVMEFKVDKDGDSYVLENVIKIADQYTFSIWIKGNINCSVVLNLLGENKVADVTTEWKKFVYTVNANDAINENSILITPEVNTTTYYYEGFLAQGTIDNAWLPAPEDLDEQIGSVRSEFIQKADSIEQKITASDGRITSLSTTIDGITGKVQDAEGKITTLTATTSGLTTQVETAKGDISKLQQTSNTLTSELSTANGDISKLKQTANSLSSDMSNTKGDISSLKQTTSGLQSTVQTAQGDISSLKQTANTLTSDISNAKGDISNLKQKADEITLEVGSIQIGGRNLVLNSNIEYSNPNYLVASYNISPIEGVTMSNGYGHLVQDEQYTISVCWTPGSKTSSLNCFLSQGYSGLGCLYTDGTQNRQITSLVITAKYTASRFPVDDARNGSVDFYRLPNVSGTVYDDVTIHWVQIERGNKATDWSPAPEDLDASIKDAHDKISQNDKQIQEAFSKIQIMKDSICSIVTSQDGSTVLEQTGGGFKFNITAIKKEVQQALEDCTNLSGDLSNTNATVDNLEKSLKGLDDKTAYIRMIVDENGKPCMELGKEMNDEFKVRITNSSIDFFDGTIRVAYINNKSLYIEKAVIKSELQIGDRVDAQGNVQGFIWATRSNGNMGLRKVAKGGAVSGIMHN